MTAFWSLAILIFYGCVSLRTELATSFAESLGQAINGMRIPVLGLDLSPALLITACVLAVSLAVLYRWEQTPKNADLLIETESELRKVSWPTLDEAINGSWAVMMTVLVLIFAEVLPKTYAISNADNMAMGVSRPVTWLVKSLSWIVMIVQVIVNFTLRLFGVKTDEGMVSAEEEIRGAIDLHHSEGGVAAHDRHMLVGALDLKDLTVADLMIHRKNINMLDIELPVRDLVMEALSSPHTRLPLYRGSQDDIVGILHAKDLLRAVAPLRGDLSQLDIASIIREPWFVPETLTVQEQLNAFLKQRNHFALVVDEYGALEGLITLEDILEEIVGDIRDEHDTLVQGVRPQPDGSVNVDGVVTIRDLNRSLHWNLPDDEAVTIAGLVIHEAQTIPEPGQRFSFHGYQFDVLRKSRNQITALRVKKDESV